MTHHITELGVGVNTDFALFGGFGDVRGSGLRSLQLQFQFSFQFAEISGMLSKFTAYLHARELFGLCNKLKIHRIFKDQLLRASSSIVLNLAEGSGKRTPADKKRFYSIALGSLRETQAILDLNGVNDPKILNLMDQLGAILHVLVNKP